MSRVFVSCAYRDRVASRRVVELLQGLGHDAVDDRGDASGMNWWSEVVRRIDTSDVFVAIATPSYVAAQSCRLAAQHAANGRARVLRLDLVDTVDRTDLDECHPVVAQAEALAFDPEDPDAAGVLAYVLDDDHTDHTGTDDHIGTDGHDGHDGHDGDTRAGPAPSTPRPLLAGWLPRPSGLEVLVAAVVLLAAAAVLGFALRGSPPDRAADRASASPAPTPSAPGSSSPSTAPSAAPADAARGPDPLAAVVAAAEEFPGFALPPSSCGRSDGSLTCLDPAQGIGSVELRSYPTRQTLYSTYADAVADLAAGPVPENTGNCSTLQSEGEVGWNRDMEHPRDYPVAQQLLGGLDPASESAGRVFCTASDGTMQLVWTEDPYLLVSVRGEPADAVVEWWSEVHLQLACVGGASGKGCAA